MKDTAFTVYALVLVLLLLRNRSTNGIIQSFQNIERALKKIIPQDTMIG